MKPFLDFKSFARLMEAEESPKEGVASFVPLFLNLYFQAYGSLVSKVEDYKDLAPDMQSIIKSEVDKKGDIFNGLVKKIAGLIKDEAIKAEANSSVVPAVSMIGEALNDLLKTASDDDKKKIQEAFTDGVVNYQNSLIKAVKSVNESYFIELDYLLEKNTFKDQRTDLIKNANTLEANINSIILNPSSDRIKTTMTELSGEVKKIKSELSDDSAWEKMKRKERKDKLVEIPAKIEEIRVKQQEAINSEVVKSGVEKTVSKKLEAAQAKMEEGNKKIAEIIQKNVEAAKVKTEEKAAEETAEFKKDKLKVDDYKEIVTGKKKVENLQKKGPNQATIQKVQETMNKYLDKQIKADGLYGEGTEKAVEAISKALALIEPEAKSDGKSMTPLFQAMLMKIDEKGGKDTIKKLLDKAASAK